MEFLIRVIFGRLIARFIGVYIRYVYYAIIGKKRSISSLSGENINEGEINNEMFLNGVAGIAFIFIVVAVFAYLAS